MKHLYSSLHFQRFLTILLTGILFLAGHTHVFGQDKYVTISKDTFNLSDPVVFDNVELHNHKDTSTGQGVFNHSGNSNDSYDYDPLAAGVGIDSLFYYDSSDQVFSDTTTIVVHPTIDYDTVYAACTSDGPFSIQHADTSSKVVGAFDSKKVTYYGPSGISSGTGQFDPGAGGGLAAGTYTIYAADTVTIDGHHFTDLDSTKVNLYDPPDVYTLKDDTSYCEGGSGVQLWLDGNQDGVHYVLEDAGSGTPLDTVTGDGVDTLAFHGRYKEGNYQAYAYYDSIDCQTPMNGTVTVSKISASTPNLEYLTDSAFCPSGGAGVELGLDASNSDYSYELYHNYGGSEHHEITKTGTGSSISFGTFYDSTGYYAVKVTNGSCRISLDDTLKIFKKNQPGTFSLSGPTGICHGASNVQFELSSSEGNTILYELYNKDGRQDQSYGDGSKLQFTANDTGTYWVMATDTSNNCSSQPMNDTISLGYHPEVNVAVTSDTSICRGSSVNLSASGGDTYQWSPDSSLVGNGTSPDVTAEPSNNTTYKVIVTNDSTGCSDSSEVEVVVNDIPDAEAGSDKSVCKGKSVQLSAGAAAVPDPEYSWNYPSTLSDSSVKDPYAFPSTTTEYTLTVTSDKGCTNTDKVTVKVDSVPNPSVSDAEVCNGENVTLTAYGGDTYEWSNGATTQSITVSPNSDKTYKVTAKYANGCEAVDSARVTVLPSPSLTVSASDNPVCEQQQVTLSASASGGNGSNSYVWSDADSTTGKNLDFTASSDVTYQATVTDQEGCKDSASIDITVNTLPNVSIGGLDSEYCKDESPVTLTGSPGTGISQDFKPDSLLTSESGDQAEFDPAAAPSTNTSYDISYHLTDANGCTNSDTATTFVSNDTIPDPVIEDLDSAYCDNDGNTYTLTGVPTGSDGSFGFSFTPSGGDGDNGDGTADITPSNIDVGSHSVTYTYTSSSGGCEGTVTETFQVGVPFTFDINSDYCANQDSFQLQVNKPANAGTGTFYVFDSAGDTLYSAKEGSPNAVFDPASQGAGDYGVEYVVSDTVLSCSNADSTGFTVHPVPDASFTLEGTHNDSVDIQFCNNYGVVDLQGIHNSGGSYYGPGVSGDKLETDSTMPGDIVISRTYTNAQGCMDSVTADVHIKDVPELDIRGLPLDTCNNTDLFEISASPDSGYYTVPAPLSDPSIFKDKGQGKADFNPSNASPGTYNIQYTGFADDGCSADTTVDVTIQSVPVVTIDGMPGSGEICMNGNPIGITGNPTDANGRFISPSFINDHGDGTATLDPSDASSSGSYQVIYEYVNSTSGCMARDTQVIDILPLPQTYNLQGGGSYCEGEAGLQLQLTDSDSSMTYSLYKDGSFAADTLRKQDGNFTFDGYWQEGTYLVTAEHPNGCLDTMSNTASITVKHAPEDAYSITGDTVVATTSTGSYSHDALDYTDQYNWEVPSGAVITSGSGTRNVDVSFSGVTPGYDSLLVYGTNSNSCGIGDTAYFKVEIVALPDTARSLTGKTGLCEGAENLVYSVDPVGNADSVGWTVPTGFQVTTGAGTNSIEVDLQPNASSGWVTARGYNASGSGYPDSLYVTVNDIPDITVNNLDSVYCNDQGSFTITSTPSGGTYSSPWSDPAIFVDNGDGTADFNPSELSGGTTHKISYSATVNGCPNDTTMKVRVNPIPDVNFTGLPDTLCSNATPVILEGNHKNSYASFSGPGINDNNDGTALFYPDSAGTGDKTITYHYVDSLTGCSNDTSQDIFIKPAPQAYTLLADGVYCADTPGDSLSLGGAQAGHLYEVIRNGTTLAYDTTVASGGGFTFDTTFTQGSYEVVATAPNGCPDTMQNEVTINRKELPDGAHGISGDDTVQVNGMGRYSVPPIANTADYHWIGAIVDSGNGTRRVKMDFSGLSSGAQTIGVYGSNGCGHGDTAHYDVYILPEPAALDSVSGDSIICAGSDGLVYQAHPTLSEVDSVSWNVPAGFEIVSGRGTHSIHVRVDSTGASSGDITAQGVNASGWGPAESLYVTVNPIPTTNSVSVTDVLDCNVDSVLVIGNSSTPGATYTWNGGGKTVHNDSLYATQQGDYTLTVDAYGCTHDTTITVKENKTTPSISTTTPDTLTCEQPQVTLEASSDAGNPYYIWTAGSGGHIVSGDSTATPTVDSAATYTVKVTDSLNGCSNTATVKVEEDFTKPSFTVNDPLDITCSRDTSVVSTPGVTDASYQWSGPSGGIVDGQGTASITVDKTGTYSLKVTKDGNGCSLTKSRTVGSDSTRPTINSYTKSGDITCSTPSVSLEADVPTSNVTYEFDPVTSGTIESKTGNVAHVETEDHYAVIVTKNSTGCSVTDTIFVEDRRHTVNVTIDVAFATITCNKPTDTLTVTSDLTDKEVEWNASNGGHIVSGHLTHQAVVDSAGRYTATVTDTITGCSNSEYADISKDFSTPVIDPITKTPDSITCVSDVNLKTDVTGAASLKWSGPGTVSPDDQDSVYVDVPGQYTLTATGSNGCTSSRSVDVPADTASPDMALTKSYDDITCIYPQEQLEVASSTPNVTYQWSRVSGSGTLDNPNSQKPKVDGPGTYEVVVTADNGCTTSGQVSVDTNYTQPVVTGFDSNPDSISCENDWVELTGSSSTSGADLLWTTSGTGDILNETTDTALVNASGTYTLTVTHPTTGCTVDSTVDVYNNFAKPDAEVDQTVGQFTCMTDTLQLDGTASTGVNFFWTTDNGHILSSNTVQEPLIGSDGKYFLTVEHPHSGCTDQDSVVVTSNNSVPDITPGSVSTDTLNCAVDSSVIQISSVSTTEYWWTTPDGNIRSGDSLLTAVVDARGKYVFTARNTTTGCTNSKSYNIYKETTQPRVDLSAEKLTCSRDTAQISSYLEYATDLSKVSYSWTTAGGQFATAKDIPNPKVVKTGTYTLTLTDDVNGCTRVKDVDVTKNTTPPDVFVDDNVNDITCSRGEVDLLANTNASDSSYEWTTSGSGNIVNRYTATPTVDAPGWYTVEITDNTNGCSSEDSVYVDEDKGTPDLQIDPVNDITCSRTTVELQAGSADDVYYSWSGGPGSISAPSSSLTEVDAGGNYTITVEDKVTGCTNDSTITVYEDTDAPAAPMVSDTGSCFGSSNVAIDASGSVPASNFTWYDDPALGAANQIATGKSYTPSMSSVGDSVFYVTQTGANGCEGPAASAVYSVYGLPDAPTATDKSVCLGQSNPFLEAYPTDPANPVNWYNTADSLLSTSDQYQPKHTTVGTYEYGVTQVDARGCESPQEQAYFTINDLPAAPIVDEDTLRICEGAPDKTFVAHGTNVKWYNTMPPASPVATGNIFTPGVSGAGTYTFYVTQSQSSTGCESHYTQVTYMIQPNPDPYSVQGGGTYCEGTGGREIYLGNSVDTISYELRRDGNTYLTNISGDGDSLTFGHIKPEGTYTVYGTAGNGCTAKMTGTAVISVDSLPEAAGTITGDSVLCQGATGVDYSVPGIPYADQYEWTIPDGAEIVAGDKSRTITVNYSDTSQSGQITVKGTNGCGEGAVSTGHAITVNAVPKAAGTISGADTICQGADAVSFEVPAIDDATDYVWSVPSGATIVSGAGSRSILVDFSESSTGGIVKVHGLNSCGAGPASPDHTVEVTPKPIISTDTYQAVCASSDSLVADDPGSASIHWKLIDGQATIEHPNSFETAVTDLGTGQNKFEVTLASNGCADVDTVVIENNQRFVNAGADQTLCSSSYILKGNEPETGVSGSWSVEQGSATFNDANVHNTSVTDLEKGTNVLRWTLTRDGCSSYDEVTIINDEPTQAEAGIDQGLCSDSTYLDANAPSIGGGKWTVEEGFAKFADPGDPNTKIRDIAKGDNLLRWTITNNTCSSSDTVHVKNNQVNVEAGPDQVICDYRTVLNAVPPVKGTGEWSIVSGSATFKDRHDPQSEVYLLVSDTTVLTWNIYYNGCQSADSMTIINNAPSRADAGDNQQIISSSTFLNATDPDKGTGEWTLLSGSAVIADKSDPKTEVTELAYGANLFQWKVTYENCVSIDSVRIDNESSGSIDAGGDTTICTNAMRLNASEPVQGVGEWSVVKGSGTFNNKNSNTTMVRNLSKGENVLQWTVIGNGVLSDKITITNHAPTDANAGPDMTYCVDSAQLSANNASVGTGQWKLIAGEGTFEDTTLNNSKIYDLGTGKNTLRWTITNNKCSSSDDVVITNNQPTQADAGVDQSLCSDEATLYGNSPAVGEGLWTLVSGSNSVEFQDQTVGNTRVTNLGHGENTLRWTITNGNCVSSDEVIITNNNPTKANAGRDKSICVDSFRLNASEAVIGTGEWEVINGYGNFDDTSNHQTMVRNLGKGGNVLRWTIKHGKCISYDEVEISNDLIEAEAGYDQSLCVDSTSLSANNAGKGDGYWSVVTGSAVFEDPSNPNTNVEGLSHMSDNVLKWTINHKSCRSTDKVTIENNSPGIVYAGEDNQVCDDEYYLKANPNYIGEGKWEALSGGADILKDSSANTKVTDMGLGRNTFRWSVSRNGCVKYDDVTIYNNLPVQAYAGESDTICTTSTTMHAEEPPFGTGQWTVVAGSGEFENDTVFNTTVSNLSQGANTFKWTVYNGRCSTSDEVTIVVNRPNVPRAGADQSICADSTTMQANLPGSGQSGHWEVVEGSGYFEDPGDPNTKVTNMSHGTNVYRWNISYKKCNLYDEVTITNEMPTEANAGQDIHVCGDKVRLNAVSPSIGSGQWSLVSGQAEFDDPSSANTMVRNLGFGPNTLRWKTTSGNCTSIDEIDVYNDQASAYAGVDQEVYRDSTTLVANSVTRGEGKWIILGGSGTFENPNASQTKVRDLSNGVNTFRWTITNNGCISSDEVSITYYEMPDPEFDVSKAEGCPPLSVQFYNESIKANSNFTWEFGDGNISTNENPRHTFYETGEYEVNLKTKGPDGSTVSEDTTIVVHDVPVARFDVAPKHLYIPEQHLQCYNMSIDADRYRWHFGDDSTSTQPSPLHHYQDTGTYDIRLEVWSRHNCYDDTVRHDVVTVEQSGKIRFPSGFTPSPHGPVGGHYNKNSKENNVFHPIVKGVESYHLEIFNRWGVKVFTSDKVEKGWDGYYQGELAEEGVYIYKVHGTYNNGTRFEKVGDFVLIRK